VLSRNKPCDAGFFYFLAMRSTALPSYCYGNPEDVYAAKQAREKRQAQQETKRPTLTLKRKSSEEWSEARKAAEALFTIPAGAGAVSAVPCPTPSAKRVELAD
jgi:hypothetical protein